MKYFDFKSFLQENPKLLSKYVAFGTYALNKVVEPVTHVMEHLLTVQGIDLNTTPKSLLKTLLQEYFDTMDRNRYMPLAPSVKVKQVFSGSFKRAENPFPFTPPLKVTESKAVDPVVANNIVVTKENLSEAMNLLEVTPNDDLSKVLSKALGVEVSPPVVENVPVKVAQAPKKKAPKKKVTKSTKVTVVKNASKSRSLKKVRKS